MAMGGMLDTFTVRVGLASERQGMIMVSEGEKTGCFCCVSSVNFDGLQKGGILRNLQVAAHAHCLVAVGA